MLEATSPFAVEFPAKSWWYLSSTLFLLAVALAVAAVDFWWPIRLVASITGGLLLVRMFILYHDFLHGSLLRGSKPAKMVFNVYGMLALTPPKNWRYTHNFHHANVGKPVKSEEGEFALVTSEIGSFPLMTTEMWQRATWSQRLKYRISRHPLTVLSAYLTVFLFSLSLAPFLKDPRKNWQGGLSVLMHLSMLVAIGLLGGWPAMFYCCLLPFTIAAACGAALFFLQHNFEGMHIVPPEQWTHYRGAVESSSYLKLGPVLRWFTGNIGYHNVHHLNSLIPFYRLPEAMKAVPELHEPIETTLRPRDVLHCLRLNLWDSEKQRLVPYRSKVNVRHEAGRN